jgi:hypothetical protein
MRTMRFSTMAPSPRSACLKNLMINETPGHSGYPGR